MIKKLKKLFVLKIIQRLLDYKKKRENIYRVEYVLKPFPENISKCNYINIVIWDLKLQLYIDSRNRYYQGNFYEYDEKDWNKYTRIEFDYYNKIYNKIEIKDIEINEQLKALLFCEDELSNSIAKQVIFQKLGLNESI